METNINNGVEENLEDDGTQEVTFDEMYSQLILSSEILLHLSPDMIEYTKTGLKNYKSRLNKKMKEQNLIPEEASLEFHILGESDIKGCSVLKIILNRKGFVRVSRIIVPTEEV